MLARATDRFETLTLVLDYCGIRFGEAVALRRKHIGNRVLAIRSHATAVTGKGIVKSTAKTKRDRHVPVPEHVWRRLYSELATDPNALVFPSRKDGFLPLGECCWHSTMRATSRDRRAGAAQPEAHRGLIGDQCRR
jgi:integrase